MRTTPPRSTPSQRKRQRHGSKHDSHSHTDGQSEELPRKRARVAREGRSRNTPAESERNWGKSSHSSDGCSGGSGHHRHHYHYDSDYEHAEHHHCHERHHHRGHHHNEPRHVESESSSGDAASSSSESEPVCDDEEHHLIIQPGDNLSKRCKSCELAAS